MSDHKSTAYTGSASAMSTSPWLASEDLCDKGEMQLTIDGVFKNENVVMEGGVTEKVLFSLAFKGAVKQMCLNATNRKALQTMFGNDVPAWIGKVITVFVQDGIRNPKGGATVSGLRIKVESKQPVATLTLCTIIEDSGGIIDCEACAQANDIPEWRELAEAQPEQWISVVNAWRDSVDQIQPDAEEPDAEEPNFLDDVICDKGGE